MIKKIISVAIVLCMVFATAACSVVKKPVNPYDDIYIIENTERLYIDEMPRVTGNEKVLIQMAKNESEGGQFVIRSSEKEYKNLKISATDFICGENKLETVELFREYFTLELSGYGQMFDASTKYATANALIPMEYSDLNVTNTELNLNTIFYIRATTNEKTVPGIYTADITLTYDGGSVVIPAEIEVWDITLPATPTYSTVFLYWEGFTQDYTKWSASSQEYKDNLEKVYEMMNGYKMTPTNAISDKQYSLSAADFATYIKEIFEKYPSFNTFSGPFYHGWDSQTENYWTMDESSKQLNINAYNELKKAGVLDRCFNSASDEPFMDWQFQNMNVQGQFFNEYFPEVKTYITCNRKEKSAGNIDIWCPIVSTIDIDYMEKIRRTEGTEYWWYYCNSVPAPTVNMYADMSNTRISGWMANNWDINGILYWCLNLYMHFNGSGYVHLDNIWHTEQWIYQGMEGDGIINRNIPIGSLNMEGCRDGIEDYDFAKALEKAVAKKVEELGLDMTTEEAVQAYYDGLYLSVNEFPSYETPDSILRMRAHAAKDIVDGPAYIMQQKTLAGTGLYNKKVLTIYTNKGAELVLNGKAQTPISSGEKYDKYSIEYQHSQANEVLTISVDGVVYTRPIIAEANLTNGKVLVDFSNPQTLEAIKAANTRYDMDFEVVEIDGESVLKVTYNNDQKRFNIPAEAFNCDSTGGLLTLRCNVSQTGADDYYIRTTWNNSQVQSVSAEKDIYLSGQQTIETKSDSDSIYSLTVLSSAKPHEGEKFSLYISQICAVDKTAYVGEVERRNLPKE